MVSLLRPDGQTLGEWVPDGAWGKRARATHTILGDPLPASKRPRSRTRRRIVGPGGGLVGGRWEIYLAIL